MTMLICALSLAHLPTVLASALLPFLDMELLLEAAQTLVLLEWSIVVCTLEECTMSGLAGGFGIGILTAAVVQLVYGAVDSVRILRC